MFFLRKAFIFLVIGKSPSFLRAYSQTISEMEEGKKKKTTQHSSWKPYARAVQ